MIVIKAKRAVKPFRKSLDRLVRSGEAKLRVFGNKGTWFLGVQVNDTIHRYSPQCITMSTATLVGFRKFHLKATQYKSKVAA